VTAPAAQAAGRLLAVFPDMVELLAVMALRKIILSSICLYPDCDVAVFAVGKFLGILPSSARLLRRGGGDRRVAVICLMLITSKLRLSSPSDMSSAGMLSGRWRITDFKGFSDLE
jgi:hypothetical protein